MFLQLLRGCILFFLLPLISPLNFFLKLFLHLNLLSYANLLDCICARVGISYDQCWTLTNIFISGLLHAQVFRFSECVRDTNVFKSHCFVLLHVTQMSDLAFFFFDCVEIVVHWNRTFCCWILLRWSAFMRLSHCACCCMHYLSSSTLQSHIDLRPWL